jgi:histidinol-phosphate/aromatic aminotransferase/cobyric acid decarboxylase-like protein
MPAASFPGLDERYVRVAVRPPVDNAVLLAALEELVG